MHQKDNGEQEEEKWDRGGCNCYCSHRKTFQTFPLFPRQKGKISSSFVSKAAAASKRRHGSQHNGTHPSGIASVQSDQKIEKKIAQFLEMWPKH